MFTLVVPLRRLSFCVLVSQILSLQFLFFVLISCTCAVRVIYDFGVKKKRKKKERKKKTAVWLAVCEITHQSYYGPLSITHTHTHTDLILSFSGGTQG